MKAATSTSTNPFAKKNGSTSSNNVVTRSSLLPTPKRAILRQGDGITAIQSVPLSASKLGTPFALAESDAVTPGSQAAYRRPEKKWRLLWRGGLEFGHDGYRLDGIAFLAQISFPSLHPTESPTTERPSLHRTFTPENTQLSPSSRYKLTASPFHAPVGKNTDFCLAIESLRGRKWMRIKGVEEIGEGELDTDGGENEVDVDGRGPRRDEGVRVYINPESRILSDMVTSVLYPSNGHGLNANGRTRKGIVIGLGDEGLNIASHTSSFVIYGQVEPESGIDGMSRKMVLMAARRKPKVVKATQAVRPGDPLPRASVFPVIASRQSQYPFAPPRSTSLASHRDFSREPSQPRIFGHLLPNPPPELYPMYAATNSRAAAAVAAATAETSGKKKTTPGRRGEKRKRPEDVTQAEVDARRKKAGKINPLELSPAKQSGLASSGGKLARNGSGVLDEEDVFGSGGVIGDGSSMNGDEGVEKKRKKPSAMETKNKAHIKKRILALMDARGLPRLHDEFQDIFTLTNKGTAFALRVTMGTSLATEIDIDRIIQQHLDIYVITPSYAVAEPAAG